MTWTVPLFDTDLGPAEEAAVTRVLRSGWLTMGPEIEAFEREFAAFLGVRHAIMVSNCTTALHLAHHVLGAGPGTEVLCPTLTFVATASSIVETGAVPVLADVAGPHDLTVSVEDLARKVTARTRGIVVMHYAGYPCDMAPVMALAKARGLYVVEDCAHSPGAACPDGATGTIGDVGCFSFFSNKNLSTGEGGMLTTNRDDVAARIRLLRSHGMTTVTLDRHRGHAFSYDVTECGFNYRSCELNAAIGRVQLARLPAKNARRQAVVAEYLDRLRDVPAVTPVFRAPRRGTTSAYHIFPVLLDEGRDREAFMRAMKDRGLQTSIHYRPIHTFTAYRDARGADALPRTDGLAGRLVTLPLFPAMDDRQVTEVIEGVRACLT